MGQSYQNCARISKEKIMFSNSATGDQFTISNQPSIVIDCCMTISTMNEDTMTVDRTAWP